VHLHLSAIASDCPIQQQLTCPFGAFPSASAAAKI
jgi:hypothetical protein